MDNNNELSCTTTDLQMWPQLQAPFVEKACNALGKSSDVVIYAAAADMVVIMDKGQVKWVGSPATYAASVRQVIYAAAAHMVVIMDKGQVLQAGFTAPTPIQAQSWPIALQSRDVVAVAKTGSEKTMAYLIPGFRMLKVTCNNPKMGPTVLVLSPTRELATQIQDEAVKFGKSSKISCTVYQRSVYHGAAVLSTANGGTSATTGGISNAWGEGGGLTTNSWKKVVAAPSDSWGGAPEPMINNPWKVKENPFMASATASSANRWECSGI
ncbi:ATP-dependent RNA helicase-like protein DB10 isoform X2 [Tanacetum coccineum]|uniref:ATP-dependent RNA helicase-like protein DB10 isoform X2 n=1 Tax=Tanacetum coccineum TaxID=301880 RepID=A0ABQ5D7Q7_9ASTR